MSSTGVVKKKSYDQNTRRAYMGNPVAIVPTSIST